MNETVLEDVDLEPDELRALKVVHDSEILGGRPSSEIPLAERLLEHALVRPDGAGRLKLTVRGRRLLRTIS